MIAVGGSQESSGYLQGSQILSAYHSYLTTFGKSMSRLDDVERIKAFTSTMNKLYFMDISLSNATYTVRLNDFADMTENEFGRMFSKPIATHSTIQVQKNGSYIRNVDNRSRKVAELPQALNWATSANPVGESVTPGVQNQGACGACWAFTAIGATEASVAINTGKKVSLSVQELVDCDRSFNSGCGGGNAGVAYDYIKEHGVAAAGAWPYTGEPEVCYREAGPVSEQAASGLAPVATISSHLTLPPRDEERMILHLAEFGPLSVGICGTDLRFVYYGGGVFNPSDCCTQLNHAILIVGYGHDHSTGLDYWIGQNSWGARWGESGFIRLQRGVRVPAGQCGIALSVSLPVGGRLLSSRAGEAKLRASHSWINDLKDWAILHLQDIMFVTSGVMLAVSVALFGYGFYLDQQLARQEQQYRANEMTALLSGGGRCNGRGMANSYEAT